MPFSWQRAFASIIHPISSDGLAYEILLLFLLPHHRTWPYPRQAWEYPAFPYYFWGPSLLILYVFIVLSDFLDGLLARKAGAPSLFWGHVDAAVDIAFNTLSLSTAAWLGRVGPWVPGGVAFLGGRFILRNLRPRPALQGRLDEDGAGKAAGVFYYLLVGAIVLELSLEGEDGRWLIDRAGDAVFIYTLFVLQRRDRAVNLSGF